MKVILASQSPRRKAILEELGLQYEVIVPDCDEVTDKTEPEEIVLDLSKKKAFNVFPRVSEPSTIIAADTIVYQNGNILEKPKDENEAFAMLKQLIDNWHTVFTGVCIISADNSAIRYCETSQVHMRKVSDEDIWDYIKTSQPFDKAGAYGVQDDTCNFVDEVKGEIETVIGLPVIRLKQELNQNCI